MTLPRLNMMAIAALLGGAVEARAVLVERQATADGHVIDADVDGAFDQVDATGGTVLARWLSDSESRGVIEFDLGGLLPTASVAAVTLRLHVTLVQSANGDPVLLEVRGHAGDGVVDLADATAPGPVLATVAVDSGPIDIPLDPSFISDLLAVGADAGVRLRVTTLGHAAGIASLEHPAMTPTTLLLDVEQVLYVDAEADGDADGSSWADAFTDLQPALDGAGPGTDIWVRTGTYRPTLPAAPEVPRSATFALPAGVALYGGFAGDETHRHQRHIADYPTVLSGDIGALGDDSDNAFHVVTALDCDATTRIDGVTITGGRADGAFGSSDRHGGGMWISGGAPQVRQCIFEGNHGASGGGGLYADGAAPLILNTSFVANTGFPGAAADHVDSPATYIHCTVTGNASGLNAVGRPLTLLNSILWHNSGTALSDQIFPFGGMTVRHCCIQGWTAPGVDGNIDDDPQFTAAPAFPTDPQRDLRLRPASPCADAADSLALPADLEDLDGDGDVAEFWPIDGSGRSRRVDDLCAEDTGIAGPDNKTVDMGAHETAPPDTVASTRLHVHADAPPGGDGSTWSSAFPELGSALELAYFNPCIVEDIWVAAGIYRPATGPDRDAAFDLVGGVTLYGGFGGTESELDQRNADPLTNGTVLSGDIGIAGDATDNSHTVVRLLNTAVGAGLDGFSVVDGRADGPLGFNARTLGAGLYLRDSAATIRNCAFHGHRARAGGAVSIDGGNAAFEHCVFMANTAFPPPANPIARGGAVFCRRAATTVFTHCRFVDNHASDGFGGALSATGPGTTSLVDCQFETNSAAAGGAVFTDAGASTTLARVHFAGNLARTRAVAPTFPLLGGAVAVLGGEHLVTDSLFATNHSGALGGALAVIAAAATVHGSTFVDNGATTAAGGVEVVEGSTLTIDSAILWNNTAGTPPISDDDAQVFDDGQGAPNTVTITYSCVQDTLPADGSVVPGIGNLDVAPGFVDAAGGNWRLMSGAAARDSGDPAAGADRRDLDGHARRLCDRTDMGAYEAALADADCDGDVDLRDLAELQRCYGTATAECVPFDGNGDDSVNAADHAVLIGQVTGP